MKFEKISRNEWIKFNSEIMSDAPKNLLDGIISAWDDIKLPQRATPGSAGYDFFAPFDIELPPSMSALIPTGIKVDLRNSDKESVKVLQMYPRSSYGIKFHMSLSNTVGIIDADYYNNTKNEGHILLSIINGLSLEGCPLKRVPDISTGGEKVIIDFEHPETKSRFIKIPKGTAFAQGIITTAFLVEDDEVVNPERTGGFGSTTVKSN